MNRRQIAAAALLALSTSHESRALTPVRGVLVSRVAAPAGVEAPGVQWIEVRAPDTGVMLAAVARPEGRGPFPAIVILHGTHGFAQQYVHLAEAVARNGVLAVAPCWFAGRRGAGTRFVTPIDCPSAPSIPEVASPEARQTVTALLRAVRSLRDVGPGRVALFGHSRGGGATVNYVLRGEVPVQAAVLNSTGYPVELSKRASEIRIPILMLHGTEDDPADGGSPVTTVERARDFEHAMQRAGKAVEAKYYEGSGHNGLFANTAQRDDTARRIASFVKRHLAD